MRVILVEDDALNRRVVRDMLQVIDIDMVEAENGEAGLDLIAASPFDLVLMDLRMPGIDGLTAIRRLRAMPSPICDTPVVVITADTAPDLKAQCSAAGADDVLLKPVALNALIDVIARVAAAGSGDEMMLD